MLVEKKAVYAVLDNWTVDLVAVHFSRMHGVYDLLVDL